MTQLTRQEIHDLMGYQTVHLHGFEDCMMRARTSMRFKHKENAQKHLQDAMARLEWTWWCCYSLKADLEKMLDSAIVDPVSMQALKRSQEEQLTLGV